MYLLRLGVIKQHKLQSLLTPNLQEYFPVVDTQDRILLNILHGIPLELAEFSRVVYVPHIKHRAVVCDMSLMCRFAIKLMKYVLNISCVVP